MTYVAIWLRCEKALQALFFLRPKIGEYVVTAKRVAKNSDGTTPSRAITEGFSLQLPQFYIPEINFLSFALQRDIARAQGFAVLLYRRVETVDHAAADLRFGILQYGIAVDNVCDERVAQNDELRFDPPLAFIRFGRGLDAVPGIDFSLKHHVGAGRAHIARRAWLAVAESCQKLHFHRNRPVLFAGHGTGVLGVEHHTAVFERVLGRIRTPPANKTVFQRQMIIRKRLMEIQMPEAVVELVVLVIPDLYDAVFYPERVAVVVARLMVMYFDDPVREVFPVEQRYPTLIGGAVFGACTSGKHQDAKEIKQPTKITGKILHRCLI